jgi:hypothetical protein
MTDNRTPILDRSDYSVIWAERFPHETDGDVLQRVSRTREPWERYLEEVKTNITEPLRSLNRLR